MLELTGLGIKLTAMAILIVMAVRAEHVALTVLCLFVASGLVIGVAVGALKVAVRLGTIRDALRGRA